MDQQSIINKVNGIKLQLLRLAEQVRQLPPNPNADQLGDNCFSVKLSELNKHNRWDARYHIFYPQYEMIAELLEDFPIESALQRLEQIIDSGKIHQNNCLTVFHPQVIENLKTLIK
jgi:hypothetical protein